MPSRLLLLFQYRLLSKLVVLLLVWKGMYPVLPPAMLVALPALPVTLMLYDPLVILLLKSPLARSAAVMVLSVIVPPVPPLTAPSVASAPCPFMLPPLVPY